MNFLIIGTGGIGSYYGARLLNAGNEVTFIARGEHYNAIREKGLKVISCDLDFDKKVNIYTLQSFNINTLENIDAIIITTKATVTTYIALTLEKWFEKIDKKPYVISLQNGVDNEDILSKYISKDKIFGAITRKIGAHIIEYGIIQSTGCAQTLIGSIFHSEDNKIFLEKLRKCFEDSLIPTSISHEIKKELWCKLIINNGVNAICALLGEKTGVVLANEKLSQIVYGLMKETVIAAKNKEVRITQKELDDMFELINKFDSIKPSMLVDFEFNRPLELKEICDVVIQNCEARGVDAPYTKSIAYTLEFIYDKKLSNQVSC